MAGAVTPVARRFEDCVWMVAGGARRREGALQKTISSPPIGTSLLNYFFSGPWPMADLWRVRPRLAPPARRDCTPARRRTPPRPSNLAKRPRRRARAIPARPTSVL